MFSRSIDLFAFPGFPESQEPKLAEPNTDGHDGYDNGGGGEQEEGRGQ